jgi:hypothetical protein
MREIMSTGAECTNLQLTVVVTACLAVFSLLNCTSAVAQATNETAQLSSTGEPTGQVCYFWVFGCPSSSAFDDPSGGEDNSIATSVAVPQETTIGSTYAADDWVHRWLHAVDTARSEQPHYVAPLITTHVLLVQQFRFDSYYQEAPGGVWTSEYGAGKGLEIIPNTRMEVQVGIPPFFFHEVPNAPDGFGDVSIFLKFRAFSAPEETRDYFIGFFLGGSFPTGSAPNGMLHTVWSPMIAAAKGWRFFDYQTTLSGNLPQSGTSVLGRQVLYNNTFQFNINRKVWPEVETNTTFFVDGPYSGDQETFLTPGLLVGPFDIAERLHFEPGMGIQIATSHFHLYDHRWIWTVRFPF